MADLDDLFLADPAVLAALDNIEREYSSNNPPGGVSDGAACSHQMPSGGAGRASSCMAGQGCQAQPWRQQQPQQHEHRPWRQDQLQDKPWRLQDNHQPWRQQQNEIQAEQQLSPAKVGKEHPREVEQQQGDQQPPAPHQHQQNSHHQRIAQQLEPKAKGPRITAYEMLLPNFRIGYKFGYNELLLNCIKRVEDREFDTTRKIWTVPFSRQEEAIQALKDCPKLDVAIEQLPQVVSTVLKAASMHPDDSKLYRNIPEAMEHKMMEFQREGVRYALAHGGRVLLGDEMGLGKTVQAIALLACYKEDWPCLIITPSSLREQWADALHRWLGFTESDFHIVYDKKDANFVRKNVKFLIISYDWVPKLKMELERKAFQTIVCDESHYIKNHKAVRTKDTVPLLKKAKRCILCSGTPAMSRPIEILQQMLALLPAAKVSVDKFADRYCKGSPWSKLSGASNLDELHALCTMTFMKRRLKKDVLDQLPPKMRQQIYLQLSEEDLRAVRQVQKQLEGVRLALKQCQQEGTDPGGVKMEEKRLLNELYIKSAEAKIKAVQQYVADLLENDEKFLIFAHHQCLLDGVEQCLRRKKVKFIRIDGNTAPHERQGLVTAFQENESHKAAVLSIRAAGQGLTLTAAHLVVIAELSWTPGEMVQAEDRAHRIGQADSVSVHYLHARTTIDDIIWQTIQNKLDNVGQTLDGRQDKLEVDCSRSSGKGAVASQSILSFMQPSKGSNKEQVRFKKGDIHPAAKRHKHDSSVEESEKLGGEQAAVQGTGQGIS